MKKTYSPKKEDLVQKWQVIDAKGRVLGRVSSEIASLLTGKNNPRYATHINVGGKVVVINAELVEVTGNKLLEKKYHRHTGYPGGIKSETLEKLLARRPEEAIRRAVSGMLPKNKLRKERLANLYIYRGGEHPHQAQIKY